MADVETEFTKNNKDNNDNNMPSDFSYSIPPVPYKWLKQYGITNEEIISNKIGWSNIKQMLIFPYSVNGDLIFWQGRYFPKQKVKCHTKGNPANTLILLDYMQDNQRVVVVEDPVSAIKVARHAPVHCLFGSSLSMNNAIRLSRMYKELIVWLDYDKVGEAAKLAKKFAPLYIVSKFVISHDDPKECSDAFIKEKIDEY